MFNFKNLKIMLNLENLGVVELNAQEKRSVDGGLWWVLLWFAAETINNPSDSYRAFQRGYDATTR